VITVRRVDRTLAVESEQRSLQPTFGGSWTAVNRPLGSRCRTPLCRPRCGFRLRSQPSPTGRIVRSALRPGATRTPASPTVCRAPARARTWVEHDFGRRKSGFPARAVTRWRA